MRKQRRGVGGIAGRGRSRSVIAYMQAGQEKIEGRNGLSAVDAAAATERHEREKENDEADFFHVEKGFTCQRGPQPALGRAAASQKRAAWI